MRKDVAVYNEATGFSIHSNDFCGVPRDAVIKHLYANVQDGVILPIRLVQDGGPHIRLIIGRLNKKEEAEWVDKFVWKLRVPCGVLVLEGGLDPRGANEDFIKRIPIPAGDYAVEFYTLYWGINGSDSLPEHMQEPPGTWYRRTHPGKKFPNNMKFYLGENPEEDPGHEEDWDDFYNSEKYEELEEPDLVDFIVRLIPLQTSFAADLQCEDSGWFPIGINPRKPVVCPTGLNFQR